MNYKKIISLVLMSPVIIMLLIMALYILKYIIIESWISISLAISTATAYEWVGVFIWVSFIIGLILYNLHNDGGDSRDCGGVYIYSVWILFITFGIYLMRQYGMILAGCAGYLIGTILMCVSVREIAIIFITISGLEIHPDIFVGFTTIVYSSVLIYLIIKSKKTEVNNYA